MQPTLILHNSCHLRTLISTAVPFWGQTTQISSSLSPKRHCGSKGAIKRDRTTRSSCRTFVLRPCAAFVIQRGVCASEQSFDQNQSAVTVQCWELKHPPQDRVTCTRRSSHLGDLSGATGNPGYPTDCYQ